MQDAPSAHDAAPHDAQPSEVCSSAGWCQSTTPPSYAWQLSISPAGQPWIVSYGAYARASASWIRHEPTWGDLANPFVFHTELYAVHAFSATDVWVGGRQGYVGHFNGSTWTEHRPAAPWPQGIWGASSDDVWILYDSGLRYRWNGSELVGQPTSQVEYSGAYGLSSMDVWGFGETRIGTAYHPAIDHFDGSTWTRTIVPGWGTVIALYASSRTNVYAVVRENGSTRLVRFDGDIWTTIDDPVVVQTLGVWGRGANDVWAVGAGGRIVHFDGQGWATSSSGTAKSLSLIGGTATSMWVAGDGIAMHR